MLGQDTLHTCQTTSAYLGILISCMQLRTENWKPGNVFVGRLAIPHLFLRTFCQECQIMPERGYGYGDTWDQGHPGTFTEMHESEKLRAGAVILQYRRPWIWMALSYQVFLS